MLNFKHKSKSKNASSRNKEIDDVKVYSENLIKNLISEAEENNRNAALFEKQYEEDFYTKEVKTSAPSRHQKLENNRSLEKYRNDFFEDYEDEDEDEHRIYFSKIISITLLFLLTVSTVVLSINLAKTKSSLASAKLQLQELIDKQESIDGKLTEDELKEEINKLEAENTELKQSLQNSENSTSNDVLNENKSNTNQEAAISSSSQSANTSSNTTASGEYVIKKGDNIWNIAKNVYGDGSQYQKILDANGLTESSVLQEGDKIKIP